MALGRPRAFNEEQALDRAMEVFWRRGYEGASLPDLTRAMGINRPSLYAAFGNKEALFRKALDRYAEAPGAYVRAALGAPTAREVAERLLRGTVELLCNPKHPKGCLFVQGALACGEGADSMRCELAGRRAASQAAVQKRFERARSEGDLAADCKPGELARFVATICQGMAVQAAGGATKKELQRIAETAMRAWPS